MTAFLNDRRFIALKILLIAALFLIVSSCEGAMAHSDKDKPSKDKPTQEKPEKPTPDKPEKPTPPGPSTPPEGQDVCRYPGSPRECRHTPQPRPVRPPVVVRPVYLPQFRTFCEERPGTVGICVPFTVQPSPKGDENRQTVIGKDWCKAKFCVGNRPKTVVKPATPKPAPKPAAKPKKQPKLLLPFGQ